MRSSRVRRSASSASTRRRWKVAVMLAQPAVQRQGSSLRRNFRLANSAISCGVAVFSISAFSIARPDTPNTWLTTLANLMLQQLERAVLLGGQRLGQGAPKPDEVTQVADWRWWHEARLDQAVAHQVGGPLGILDVGLTPRHGLDMMGIGDDQLELAFQDGMDRLPVNPGALHADMRHALQPIPQRLQIPRHRRKRPDLLVRLAVGLADQHTGDHRRLMDVETGTAFDDRFHHRLREAVAVAIAAPHVKDRSSCWPEPGRDSR